MSQLPPNQAISINGQPYSYNLVGGTNFTFTSVPPAANTTPPLGGPVNCILADGDMKCNQENNISNLYNCQTSQINGGNQIICQVASGAASTTNTVKAFAQVPVTPINSIYVNSSWL